MNWKDWLYILSQWVLCFVCCVVAYLVALFFMPQKACAAEIGVHLVSQHYPKRTYNNNNPGMYFRADNGITAGFYDNSYNQWSVYAGYTYHWNVKGWEPAVTLGAITGYPKASVMPVAVPTLATPPLIETARLRLGYKPKVGRNSSDVIHLIVVSSF